MRRLLSPEALVDAMRDAETSNRALADKAGCSGPHISQLRTGHVRSAVDDLAARIETALNVTPGTIFDTVVTRRVPDPSSSPSRTVATYGETDG